MPAKYESISVIIQFDLMIFLFTSQFNKLQIYGFPPENFGQLYAAALKQKNETATTVSEQTE